MQVGKQIINQLIPPKKEGELTKCGWTPFDGKTFNSSVYGTIINGRPIVIDGKLVSESSSAEKIIFDR